MDCDVRLYCGLRIRKHQRGFVRRLCYNYFWSFIHIHSINKPCGQIERDLSALFTTDYWARL